MGSPSPSLGYPVEQLPAFLRPTAAQSKIVRAPSNGVALAEVDPDAPEEIKVREPEQFTLPAETHEQTHIFEDSRNPAVIEQENRDLVSGQLPKTYDYGGLNGLMRARLAGKTIANYGPEQRAEMVKDFQQQTQGAVASGNAAALDRANAAYAPIVRQLAAEPGKNDSMTTMTQQDLTPAPPGLPPATESGILAPDKLMGGEEKALAYPGAPAKTAKTLPELRQRFRTMAQGRP